MNLGFTIGTLFVGVCLLVWEIGDWWPGLAAFRGKKTDVLKLVSPLAPFFLCWCVGALVTLLAGGLVAMWGDVVVWGAGWLGDAAYVWGLGGPRQAAPVAQNIALTVGGRFMTGLVLAVYLVRRKKGAVPSKRRGYYSGMTMGLSAGVARFAAVPLASGVNIAGAWITGVIS